MKLDKIRFARLVKFITELNHVNHLDLNYLDEIVDIEEAIAPRTDAEALHVLMSLMQEGTRKIEAIKQHRMMTGYGLKESKDAVEEYWPVDKPDKIRLMLAKIEQQKQASDAGFGFTLEGFTSYQLNKVKEFIESF